MKESNAITIPGLLMVVVLLVIAGYAGLQVLTIGLPSFAFVGIGLGVLVFFLLGGFFIVQPNQAMVLTMFGKYRGTERRNGLFWTIPNMGRQNISLRIRNFNSERLKVNDANGNPIEIAAIVVWRVVNTASASFDVEDYRDFVTIQSEAAVRHLASRYPYDAPQDELSLRGNADQVAETLQMELASRLKHAGVKVLEARLSHLAYAPEIAGAMLQRQQAAAVVAARATIVQGAVGIVDEALRLIAENNIVELNEERKAQLVSNLLVVLTSEKGSQPVLNASNI